MGKALFVTGTGTDVGKTFVTGLIVKKLTEAGLAAGYYKAAMSGNVKDDNGQLIPGDAVWVKEAAGLAQPTEAMCPYVYEMAVSPHLAARLEHKPISPEVIADAYQKVLDRYDYVTVEGIGGILCPIAFDEHKLWLEDVVKMLGLSSVIVADAGLGTINSVGLTCAYMKMKHLPVKGIIFNNWTGGAMQEDNLKMCEALTGVKVIARVAPGDDTLAIDTETLLKLYE
ncbi:MAG: dethiobiotin synthase [Lachnospiraceae bacterium]|nr:dethiobiotin synthase [Lachnospiraceae bacterium]